MSNRKTVIPRELSSGIGTGAKLEANAAPAERLLYGRKQASIALSISLRAVDYELSQGAFETRRYGKRVLITARSLKQWANANHYGPAAERKPIQADQEQHAAM